MSAGSGATWRCSRSASTPDALEGFSVESAEDLLGALAHLFETARST